MNAEKSTNPIPMFRLDECTDEARVAYDAYEDTKSLALMVGLPCTVGIGSDRYAGKVVKTTAKTITVEWNGDTSTFRLSKHGSWRSDRSLYLVVGYAKEYMDPSF